MFNSGYRQHSLTSISFWPIYSDASCILFLFLRFQFLTQSKYVTRFFPYYQNSTELRPDVKVNYKIENIISLLLWDTRNKPYYRGQAYNKQKLSVSQ